MMTWHYKRFFSCKSKVVLYLPICNNSDLFLIRQTEELKQCTRKQKSGVNHPNNSNYKKMPKTFQNLPKNERAIFQNLPV